MERRTYTEQERIRIEGLKELLFRIQDDILNDGIAVLEGQKRPEARKRLYARCYWTVFQRFLEKYGISQRKMCEDLGKQPSTIAQMIHRNTFPSAGFEEMTLQYLSDIYTPERSYIGLDPYEEGLDDLRRKNVIPALLRMKPDVIDDILYRFDKGENDNTSDIRKEIDKMLKGMDEAGLIQVKDYIEFLKSRI